MASPATVSRCGMVYNDYTDLGWKPFVQSWLDKRHKVEFIHSKHNCLDWKCNEMISPQDEAEHLKSLFDKYIESTLNFKKHNCKELIPITELNGVISLCRLYDSLATSTNGVLLHLNSWMISAGRRKEISLSIFIITHTKCENNRFV